MVGARRAQQPLTASGRPKRATILKKEAEKGEPGESKPKTKPREKEKKPSGNSKVDHSDKVISQSDFI